MFNYNFTNFNLNHEYQRLYEILMKYTETMPIDIYGYNTLLNIIHTEMYPIMNNISNYYIYKDTLQDETTVFHEIFDKLYGIHNNCLNKSYESMYNYIDLLSSKISFFAREREKYGTLESEVNKLFQETLINNGKKNLRIIKEDLEKLIIMTNVLKEKSDKYIYN